MSNPPSTLISVTLISATGYPEHTLRFQESFHTLYQRKFSRLIGEAIKEQIHILDYPSGLLDHDGPHQSLTTRPPLAPTAPNLTARSKPHFKDQLRCMTSQELRR